jgi:hypothetical protein
MVTPAPETTEQTAKMGDSRVDFAYDIDAT